MLSAKKLQQGMLGLAGSASGAAVGFALVMVANLIRSTSVAFSMVNAVFFASIAALAWGTRAASKRNPADTLKTFLVMAVAGACTTCLTAAFAYGYLPV